MLIHREGEGNCCRLLFTICCPSILFIAGSSASLVSLTISTIILATSADNSFDGPFYNGPAIISNILGLIILPILVAGVWYKEKYIAILRKEQAEQSAEIARLKIKIDAPQAVPIMPQRTDN